MLGAAFHSFSNLACRILKPTSLIAIPLNAVRGTLAYSYCHPYRQYNICPGFAQASVDGKANAACTASNDCTLSLIEIIPRWICCNNQGGAC